MICRVCATVPGASKTSFFAVLWFGRTLIYKSIKAPPLNSNLTFFSIYLVPDPNGVVTGGFCCFIYISRPRFIGRLFDQCFRLFPTHTTPFILSSQQFHDDSSGSHYSCILLRSRTTETHMCLLLHLSTRLCDINRI
jgi:hypothetical protein